MQGHGYLYQKVTQYLLELVENNLRNPSFVFPTEMEIAEKQNVSRITVRKAFAELEKLHLIKRVKGSGTYISETATADMLAPILGKTTVTEKKIALIFPIFEGSPHIMDLFSAIIGEASDLFVSVALSEMSPEREKNLIHKYLKMGVDGIILYPIDNDMYNSELITLANTNFPLVLIDRSLTGLNFACVSSDHYGMVTTAITHLFDRGHEHILYFNSNLKTNSALIQRQDSYIQNLNAKKNYNQYFFTFCGDLDPTSASFAEEFAGYLETHPAITAIIAADYASGVHLLQMLALIHAEDKYDVVCLDFNVPEDIYHRKNTVPPHIQQDARRIGQEAVRLLKDIIDRKRTKNERLLIPATLILA